MMNPTPSNLGLVVLEHEYAHLLGLARVHPEQVPNDLLAQSDPPSQGGPVLERVLVLPEKSFRVAPFRILLQVSYLGCIAVLSD